MFRKLTGCVSGVEVTAVSLPAAGVAAGQNESSQHERETDMASTKKTAPKPAKKAGAKQPAEKKAARKKARGMSAIDAAAKVLGESKQPMNTKQMIEQMAAKGYWKSPGGKTPASTLYASILRELQTKGKDARFKKTDRGLFTVGK
jgi:hypothetical protein